MLDLNAIEARANAATPGPYTFHANPNLDVACYPDEDFRRAMQRRVVLYGPTHPSDWVADIFVRDDREADAEFFAHAREDIPALVARVRELEAAIGVYMAHTDHQFSPKIDIHRRLRHMFAEARGHVQADNAAKGAADA